MAGIRRGGSLETQWYSSGSRPGKHVPADDFPTLMRRIRITVCYDGSDFHGWQIQPDLPTIQEELQAVLGRIETKPVQVAGSGRTDAGVHALAQVAAFDLDNPIPAENLRRAMNRLLPKAIRVLSAEEAPPSFHPIRDAVAKTYEYRIYRSETCPPFERRYVYHYPYPLDVERMEELARAFEGVHDFRAFAASDTSDVLGRSKVRRVFSSEFERRSDRLIYRVRGSGFLKHMVRNLVGTLMEGGRGNVGRTDIDDWLALRRQDKAGPTAPPSGLFLVNVEY